MLNSQHYQCILSEIGMLRLLSCGRGPVEIFEAEFDFQRAGRVGVFGCGSIGEGVMAPLDHHFSEVLRLAEFKGDEDVFACGAQEAAELQG